MRNLRRLAWAAVAAAATASPAAAQQGGGTGGTGGTTTGGNLGNFTTNNTGNTGSGLSTDGSTASGGSTGGSSGTTGSLGGAQLTVEKAPVINSPTAYITGSGTGKVQASNFLAPTYTELRAQGILVNARNANYAPGSFGNPVFGTTTGATGATAATTGRAGATGGGLSTDPGGQLVQLPRQIAYSAQLKFAVPPIPAPRLQADLRGVIDRAPSLANPAGVQLQVNGNAVVLRGSVRDGDEARLVEGLVRLTPGVGRIANELTFPR